MASLRRSSRSGALLARRALSSLFTTSSEKADAALPALSTPLLRSAFSVPRRNASSEPNPMFYEVYNRQRQILPINHMVPEIAADAWVAPNAVLAGGVTIEDQATVWYGAVLRADLNYITVGFGSNIQDAVIIHSLPPSTDGLPTETRIGRNVTVGQGSVLTSCEVEDEVIIGQKCVVPVGAIVERHAVLSDGSVLGEGELIPSGQMWAGNPARFVRNVTADEKADIPKLAESMRLSAQDHSSEFLPFSAAYVQGEKLVEALKK